MAAISIRDAALEYISRGWPVLALYTTTKQGCACGSDTCKSPGKHPRPDLCPHGVHDATLEASVIASWPDDINIGIALGYEGLMCFDVDIVAIAAQFLDPMTGMSDETGIVATGRPGAHIYFICTGAVNTSIVTTKDGKHIGEIRGKGAYVVAPPSRAATGRIYKWLGIAADANPRLARTADAGAFVIRLLDTIGTEATASRGADAISPEALAGEVKPLLRIPKAIRKHSSVLQPKQVLAGAAGVLAIQEDKSKHIFRFALSIGEASQDLSYALTLDVLAGLIKQADIVYYNKYVADVKSGSRTPAGADIEYRRIAHKVLSRNSPEVPPDTSASDDEGGDLDIEEEAAEIAANAGSSVLRPEDVTDDQYVWDADQGIMFLKRTRGNWDRLYNFVPRLLAEILIDRGVEGDMELRRRISVTLHDGRQEIITLLPDDWASPRGVAEAIARDCPSEYIIFSPHGPTHIRSAMQIYSDMAHLPRYKVRAVPGWLQHGEQRLYLLPGAAGAIGPEGVNSEVRADPDELQDDDPIMDIAYAAYGKGVRQPAPSEREMAWNAFERLIMCGKLEITLTLTLQVLAGPLFSAGVSEVPPLLHVTGKTGVLKTSFCLAALSVFGTFKKTTPPPASWHGTPHSIRLLLHNARDLTLLVDDYKEAGVQKQGVADLINSYADRSARRRATPNQKIRAPDQPRGLLMSNGEDRWEREASNVARSVILEIQNNDIDDKLLTVVQESITHGELQLFGGAFLTWLAAQDELFESEGVSAIRDGIHKKLLKRYRGREMHRRLMASASSLLAVGDVMRRFLNDWMPEKRPIMQQWLNELGTFFVEGAEQRATEVEELSAFNQLVGYLAAQMAVGAVVLQPEAGVTETQHKLPSSSPRAEVVGWWSQEGKRKYVHLADNVTFAWYKAQMRRQGEAASFSWRSFLQEARSGFHGEYKARRVWMDSSGERVLKRVITFRLDLLGISKLK